MRRLAALVAASAAALTLAACGGGAGTPDTQGGATTRTGLPLIPTTDAGTPATLAVQDDRLVNDNAVVADRVALIAATGAAASRVDVFWKDIAPTRPADPTDPADPAYRFTRLDAIVRGLADAGITPILVVFNAPAWASGGTTTVTPAMPYNSVPPDPQAYADVMRALAGRYSGTFQVAGTALPAVRYWEVWNEPNLSLFLHPRGGTRAWLDTYAALARAAYPALKAGGGPGTVVFTGAAGPRGLTGRTAVGAMDWLVGLRARDVPLDIYSQHIYPAAAPRERTPAVPSWATLPKLLDALQEWRPGLGIAITEAGYTTAATPYRRTFVTEQQQAQNLRDIMAIPVVRDPRVRLVVWFNLQDNANWPAGLLREDGSEKPSDAVFRELSASEQRPIGH